MEITTVAIPAIVVGASALFFTVFLLPSLTRVRLVTRAVERQLEEVRGILSEGERVLPTDMRLRKKQRFLAKRIRISYFLLSDVVWDLYAQLQPMRITQRQTRSEKKRGFSVGFKFPFVEPKGQLDSTKAEEERFERFERDISLYTELETILLEGDRVLLGLEDFQLDEQAVEEVKRLWGQLEKTVRIARKEAIGDQLVEAKKKELALTKIEELRKASGLILIEGRLTIRRQDSGWLLEYDHPVSDYAQANGKRVTIRVECKDDLLRNKASAPFPDTPTVSVTIMGQINRWDEQSSSLAVDPIVVYSSSS